MKRLWILLAGVAALALGAATAARATDNWTASVSVVPATITEGQFGHLDVVFTGPPENAYGVVQAYEGFDCAGDGVIVTKGDDLAPGDYHWTLTNWSAGTYSFSATVYNNGDQEKDTSCANFTVLASGTSTGTAATPPPPPSSVFLCYSASQTNPGVWPASQAASLMAQGYWSPYAVAGNVAGGTNVGKYHLVCNLATGQAAGQQFAGADGYVAGTDLFKALTGAPGWYPVVP